MTTAKIKRRKNGTSLDRMTQLEQQFCLHLIGDADWNAAEAVRLAGYKTKYPSQLGQTILERARVKAFLGKVKREREERLELNADLVLRQLVAAYRLDFLEFFEPMNGSGWVFRGDLKDIPVEIRRCVKKFKVKCRETEEGTETVVEVEMMDKDAVADKLMKHLSLYNEVQRIEGSVGLQTVLPQLLESMANQDDGVIDASEVQRRLKDDNSRDRTD